MFYARPFENGCVADLVELARTVFGAVELDYAESWLGGVVSEYRRRGLARNLLELQHAWASERGYLFVETGAVKDNTAMLSLNLSAGFEIIGNYARTATPRVILQKQIGCPGQSNANRPCGRRGWRSARASGFRQAWLRRRAARSGTSSAR